MFKSVTVFLNTLTSTGHEKEGERETRKENEHCISLLDFLYSSQPKYRQSVHRTNRCNTPAEGSRVRVLEKAATTFPANVSGIRIPRWLGHACISCEFNRFHSFFACTFCFPNTNHVIILRRIGSLFCSLKTAHASMNMPACSLFNEQNNGPNLLSISTCLDLY